jgi:hypothetical protein
VAFGEGGGRGCSGSPDSTSCTAYFGPPGRIPLHPPRAAAGMYQRRPSPAWTKTESQRDGSRCFTRPFLLRLPPRVAKGHVPTTIAPTRRGLYLDAINASAEIRDHIDIAVGEQRDVYVGARREQPVDRRQIAGVPPPSWCPHRFHPEHHTTRLGQKSPANCHKTATNWRDEASARGERPTGNADPANSALGPGS